MFARGYAGNVLEPWGKVMSIGQQSAALARLLHRVRGEIYKHPAFTRGAGGKVDDMSYFSDAQAIDDMARDLSRISAQIQRLYASARFQEQIASRTPRGKKGPDLRWQKFRQQQSARDKRKSVDQVYQLASDVLGMLEHLRDANNRPPIEDILAEAMKEVAEGVQEAVSIVEHHKGHYENIDAHATGMYNVPLPLIIALIALYLKVRKR